MENIHSHFSISHLKMLTVNHRAALTSDAKHNEKGKRQEVMKHGDKMCHSSITPYRYLRIQGWLTVAKHNNGGKPFTMDSIL